MEGKMNISEINSSEFGLETTQTREIKIPIEEKKVPCNSCGAPVKETAEKCRWCHAPVKRH